MQLSYTKIDKYLTCPALYKYYYIDGYRESIISSALFFGTNIGQVIQQICLAKKDNLTEAELKIKDLDPHVYFDQLYQKLIINEVLHDLPDCLYVHYFKSDLQPEIFTKWDRSLIYNKRTELSIWEEVESLYEKYKSYKTIPNETRLMNYIMWISTKRKAHYMIDVFLTDIFPKIHKVYAIEKEIRLENNAGDTIIGYEDLNIDFEYPDGQVKRTIIDIKTSSAAYKLDSVRTKMQLSIYNYADEVDQIGYFVFLKTIKRPKNGKRVGQTFAEYQILVDKVPEEIQEEMIAKIDEVCHNIKKGEFKPSYRDKCMVFGKRCFMFSHCVEGKGDKFLYKKGRDDK